MVRVSGSPLLEGRPDLAREPAFLGISTLLFVASVAGTIYLCGSMSGGMTMPGGWTMSMAWMRMPGQSWLGASAAFMGMWGLMMGAMMLPSLVLMLSSYRRSMRGADETHRGGLTVLAGAGYFFVWAVFAAAAYPLGVGLGAAEVRWQPLARSVPVATGVVLLLAGCLQLTAWKARQLRHCLGAPSYGGSMAPNARSAWQHGLRLGVHCALCCSGFMIILLATGVADLGAMALLAVAITVERLAPSPERTARVVGGVIIAAGALVIARTL